MKQAIQFIFGTGSDLEVWQLASRAAVVFAIAIVLIRASGRRSFGQHTVFDACITVLLGAVLSRAVVGASPFWPTVAGGAVLVGLHRLVAHLNLRSQWFEDLVTGREIELVHDGILDRSAMRQALVTDKNLQAAIRQKLGTDDLSRVRRAVLERDGRITIIGSDGYISGIP